MSNGLTFETFNKIIFAKYKTMLGYDMTMTSAIFQVNRRIIDGKIDEKYVLQIYQNNCGPG